MFLAQVLLTAEPDAEVVKLPVTGDTASDFGGTATLEQDAALTLTVRYYLDNILIDSFTPAQRLVRGAHALALFYPFPDLEGAASHRWSVRLLCAGGGVKIAKGAKVRNCVLMQGTTVDQNVELDYIVTDKNVHVTMGRRLLGNSNFPVYIEKGTEV